MKKFVLSLAVLPFLIVSCSDDDTVLEIPEETITDVEVFLESESINATLAFQDEDAIGLGGSGEFLSDGVLLANTTYMGSFAITNGLDDDEDVTEEILELDNEHQFFFEASEGLNIDSVTYEDIDDNGYPVGLQFELTTGEVSTGIFRITLRHEPNKSAEGVSDGDITNEDAGSTDFALEFPIVIE